MDLSNVRRMGKQPYETVREQFGELGDRVIARHWDDGAPVRQGYRRFLGTLDELAGRLLDDEQIAQRGQDLLREEQTDGAAGDEAATGAGAGGGAGSQGAAAPDETAGAAEAREAGEPSDAAEAAGAAAGEAGDSVWSQASDEADAADGTEGAAAPGGTAAPEGTRATGGTAGAGDAAGAGAAGDAGAAQAVDVVFSLPADTAAEHVALCGEFNDWSPESISLTRGDDGSWQVTVPLAPGSYRYKYLLDGETWENGADADRYEENAYGTVDSVIVVS
jgi:hypothetical protein